MTDQPDRTYGVLGDLHYYIESSLDEEDGHCQWTVTVMLGEDHEEVAGWYWYDDNEIVVQKLDPLEPLEEQLAKLSDAVEKGPVASHSVASSEKDAIARILSGWEDMKLVDED
jgi:hypothetical protein